MRIAKETVWITTDGKLVEAGDPKAATLLASKNHPVPAKKLDQFSKGDLSKFFKDATFDPHGALELPDPLKPAKPVTYSRLHTVKETKAQMTTQADAAADREAAVEKKREKVMAGPKPKNREDSTHKKLRKRKR